MSEETSTATANTAAEPDLNEFDTKSAAEKGILVELENPKNAALPFVDANGVPYSITILGSDASKVRTKNKKHLNHYFTLTRKGKDLDADTSESEQVDKLAAATLAWHLPKIDGVHVPCSENTARKLYSDPRFPWIVDQLLKVMSDRSRFFTNSSTS